MKFFLRITVFCMTVAGIYGFADLIHDTQTGTLIQYDRGDLKGITFTVPRGSQPKTALEMTLTKEALLQKGKKIKTEKEERERDNERIKLGDLSVESFSRGEFTPVMEDSAEVVTASTDSLIKH
jgi:hypothetical protein